VSLWKELRETLGAGVKDYSLLTELNAVLCEVKLEPRIVQQYCDILFKIYDLSNSAAFVKHPSEFREAESVGLEEMAVSIKVAVLRMLGCLVAFFNDNLNVELPHSLIEESLSIMIMLSRVLLDLDRVTEVRSLYPLVKTFREAVGQPKKP
jgi:hypothetical protein